MSGPREVLDWSDFGVGTRALAQQIADDGYQPDIVLAVARGGLLPAGAVAYALGVKNVFTMNVEFYTGVDQRLDFPVMLPPLLNRVELADRRVLIVDDVADTGATLQVVEEFCADHVAEIRAAVLYEKTQSSVRCPYVWKRTDDWIDFPWSAEPPVTGADASAALPGGETVH
ncbi:MAG TPA: phosphoribosyltransferase [Mycobacteriales bacterium]|nr:phosphoribosyltransferase [Mycobacteriales bacterium]